MITTYIALGSNLNQPAQQLNAALSALSQLPESKLSAVSSFYRSKPLGPQDQPHYTNAVARLETDLPPLPLLDALQRIELNQGRLRLRRWGARTLDLDILLYGDKILRSERLIVPHYDMQNREFVIIPLHEIAPDLILPDGKPVKRLLARFAHHTMIKL